MTEMLRRHVGFAFIATAAVAFSGVRPLVAVSIRNSDTAKSKSWVVQNLERGEQAPQGFQTQEPMTLAELESLRREVSASQPTMSPNMAKLMERALRNVDRVLNRAKGDHRPGDLPEGVTVKVTPSEDGRTGSIRTFYAGGKARVRAFVAEYRRSYRPAAANMDVPDGSAPTGGTVTGRWKVDGSTCYWDENDSGADQCTPSAGRWKTGNDGCYFDSGDNGPDQCEAAYISTGTLDAPEDTCYYEGQPADCATPEQIDQVLADIAQAESDLDAAETEAATISADIEAYCVTNPSDPGCDDRASGPSECAMKSCGLQQLAVAATSLTLGSRIIAGTVVATGKGAALAALGTSLGIAGASLAVVAAVGWYGNCRWGWFSSLPTPLYALREDRLLYW